MKCAAVTIRRGCTVQCAREDEHIYHYAPIGAGPESVSWRSTAEVAETARAILPARSTEEWMRFVKSVSPPVKRGDTRTDPSKVQWSQLAPFLPALELVARAFMFGADKHHEKTGTEAWRTVEDAARIFGDKAARHALEHVAGRKFDPDSKLPHLALCIANLLIALTNEGEILS